jgi:hypothetical protein
MSQAQMSPKNTPFSGIREWLGLATIIVVKKQSSDI